MAEINISEMSPEQLAAIEKQIADKRKAEKKRIDEERNRYRELVNQAVSENMHTLMNVSSWLSDMKAGVFESFAALVEMKRELFGVKEDQRSHTFSDDNGNSIEIGYRIIDGWDDTVGSGEAKVREYIDSLATDDKTAALVDMVNRLLRKDAKGNLKANRVLDLQQMADKLDSELFSEGVDIIRKAYKPTRSAYFIEATTRDEQEKKVAVSLSLTSVGFPEGKKVNLEAFE